MALNSNLCIFHSMILGLLLLLLFSTFFGYSNSQLDPYNTFTFSSFSYPGTELGPFDWSYTRVELPPTFSSLLITLNSDVKLNIEDIRKAPKSEWPIICFRDGSLPLPDASNAALQDSVLVPLSNLSVASLQGLQNAEQCYPMQQSVSIKLTNEQISPGVWYFGLFNGIGPIRTQSKMIRRGSSYTYTVNVTVEGCTTSTMWGQDCNQTVDLLSCGQFGSSIPSLNQTIQNVVFCSSNSKDICIGNGDKNLYSLDVSGGAVEVTILATNLSFNSIQSKNSLNISGVKLMCYARYGAIPSASLHDYSGDLSEARLVIDLPKSGLLYFSIFPVFSSEGVSINNVSVCYSMEAQLRECRLDRAGSECAFNKYVLQTVLRRRHPFESYYFPVTGAVSPDSGDHFPLEPFFDSNNSTHSKDSENFWTYFVLDVPQGGAGGSIRVQLNSDSRINYEIYTRFGGLPSFHLRDFYYANTSSNSDGSMFFSLYDSRADKVDFYIVYPREGTWGFGVRRVNTINSASDDRTTLSISLERCPKGCSSHGKCNGAYDASGLTIYSYCSCDLNHGGFDCSIELVSDKGHVRQSIFLIASNAAAIFPALWALRQKAFSEWVIFTASGTSSALYHACDVGTWCVLSFSVLQFMDFWLSFMAVVSTFVYLAIIDEVYKRAIHTVVAILTALMAATNATRSSNIFLVLAIGSLGLVLGFLIELSTKFRWHSFSSGLCLNVIDRWRSIKRWVRNLMKTIIRRFQWGFIVAGFTALAMAAISWKMETSESYWIWHSTWHLTIYTSSFFFLCSKSNAANVEQQERPLQRSYELTRQDSVQREDASRAS